jgi:hypothetical protein
MNKQTQKDSSNHPAPNLSVPESKEPQKGAEEIGGRKGPEPTRYGDWEKNGRCVDF